MDSNAVKQYDPRSIPGPYDSPTARSAESAVGNAVQQQNKLLAQLAEAIATLENRLGYGLRPSPPAAVSGRDERSGSAGPARSSLADTLHGSNSQIAEANARLADITSRVDL